MPLFSPQIIIAVIMVIDNTLCFTKAEYRFRSRAVVFLNKLVRGASLPPGANASRRSFVPRRQKVERSPPPSRTPTAGAAGDSVPRDGRRHGRGATRDGGGSRLRPAVIRRPLSGAAGACGGGRRAGEPPRRLGAAAGLPSLVLRPRFEALSASGAPKGAPGAAAGPPARPEGAPGARLRSLSVAAAGTAPLGAGNGARRAQPASFRDPRGPPPCLLVAPGPPRFLPCGQEAGGGGEQRRGTLRAGGTVIGVVIRVWG